MTAHPLTLIPVCPLTLALSPKGRGDSSAFLESTAFIPGVPSHLVIESRDAGDLPEAKNP